MNNEGYNGHYQSSDRYWWLHTKYTHLMVPGASIYLLNVSSFKNQTNGNPRLILGTIQSITISRGSTGMKLNSKTCNRGKNKYLCLCIFVQLRSELGESLKKLNSMICMDLQCFPVNFCTDFPLKAKHNDFHKICIGE